MSVNMWVRIAMNNPANGSLVRDMNGGYDSARIAVGSYGSVIRHLSRIAAMGTGWIR